jgi:hypothetical protein
MILLISKSLAFLLHRHRANRRRSWAAGDGAAFIPLRWTAKWASVFIAELRDMLETGEDHSAFTLPPERSQAAWTHNISAGELRN